MTDRQPADFPSEDFEYTRNAHIPAQGPGDGTKYARDLTPGDLVLIIGTWREVEVVTLGEDPIDCVIDLRPMSVAATLDLAGQSLTLALTPDQVTCQATARFPYVPRRA